ncbi:MAG: hypothetical protein ACLFUB_05445 [Cyclobacteriaceae bacterium]
MNTITIKAPTKKDAELLRQMAEKMGYAVWVDFEKDTSEKQPLVDEITLMSEPSLSEAWLSSEDDVYNDL